MRLFYYKTFKIEKSDGSLRTIREPSIYLKRFQKHVNNILPSETIECVQGFSKGKSIITNALCHINAKWSIHYDIENFFPTISNQTMERLFRKFNIPGFYLPIVGDHDRLPQGSPCSPKIANLAAWLIDQRISKLCNELNCVYTRYADDLTISGNQTVDLQKLTNVIKTIIESCGFRLKTKKTRTYVGDFRIITGIIIKNHKLMCSQSIILECERLTKISNKSKKQSQKLTGLKAFIDSVENANKGCNRANRN